jgi:hypothetical protein
MRIDRRVCIDSFASFRRYESGWLLSLGSLVVMTRSTSSHVSVTFSIAAVHTINGHEDKMETSSRGSLLLRLPGASASAAVSNREFPISNRAPDSQEPSRRIPSCREQVTLCIILDQAKRDWAS